MVKRYCDSEDIIDPDTLPGADQVGTPQGVTVLQPRPQETHFRVVQEFCKKDTAREQSGRFVSVCGV